MEEREKGLSTGTSVTQGEKVGGENLEVSLIQMEDSFSVEDGTCNGKDVMVEILGSDVYIDGVCTRGSGAELSDEVGVGGSVEDGEGLGKDVESEGLGSVVEARLEDSRAVESEEARSGTGNALGCSLTGISVGGGEHVPRGLAEEDNQKERNLVVNGEQRDGNDVTLATLDEQKNSDNLQSDKILDKEVRVRDKVEFEERSTSDKVDGGADTSHVSSDRGQGIVDNEKGDVFASGPHSGKELHLNKNVSDADQGSRKRIESEVEDQPETERIKIMEHTAEIKEKGNSDQGDVAPMDESNIRQNVELLAGSPDQIGSNGNQEVEEFDETEQEKTIDRRFTRRASMKLQNYEARYLLPTEKEGEFSVSDMVWGKVKSHPWWPGQIFDPSDASEKAMKHYKKDCYLVAYFGDKTFAWNEASQLKPFRTHFFSIEKQSTSESFQNAVDCALDELSRRVEYGLSCSCIPKDTYDSIKFQTVENAGIRPEVSSRHGVDESLNANSFSPDKLIEYLKALSRFPTGGFDHLELVIAKAQLLAFNRFKGYSCLPELQYCEGELQYCGGLDNDKDILNHEENKVRYVIEYANSAIENDGLAGLEYSKGRSSSRHKRKHNLKDTVHQSKKERRLSDLMGGSPDSPDGGYWSDEEANGNLISPRHSKKRRTIDHYADEGKQDGRKTISLAEVSNAPKQSFKIGDCIRRVASQLTGSPSMLKCSTDRSQKTDASTPGFSESVSDIYFQDFDEAQRSSGTLPTEYSSLNDLLSSLQLVAQEPLGDFSSLNAIVSFFSDFRNSVIEGEDSLKEILCADKGGTKRKKSAIAGSPKTFEFEDMNDTYWTDRVIDNGVEEQAVQVEQPSRKNRKKEYQIVYAEPGKPVQAHRRSYSKKKYADNNRAEAPEKPPGYIDENAPAELVMNFAELDAVPAEANLNKMFRRFGPLKESETEVDRVTSRARVVFKRCADAEVARSSAEKFNIFGPILVNYQLNYTPSAFFKTPYVAATQDQEMHLDLSNFDVNIV